jgi:hypothetical protein
LANLLYDHADGRIECGFYIQIAGVQQDGVFGCPHGRRFPTGIAFIPAADIGQTAS